jgi:hypothetical protein
MKLTHESYTIEIVQDEDATSPREWDNLGEILYTSTRYKLGDRHVSSEEIQEIMDDDNEIWLPVFVYIHGGTWLATEPFSCPWDSGMCGIIHVSKKDVHKMFGTTGTQDAFADARADLQGEIETYNQWLTGDVYGYTITNEAGEFLDSCWGFFGLDYCKEEALSEARHIYEHAYHQGELDLQPA